MSWDVDSRCGIMEKVYARALFLELTRKRTERENAGRIPHRFPGSLRWGYTADLVVEDRVIVELKCVDAFTNQHLAQ